MTNQEYLWIRLGDGDTYENFGDDFSAGADCLRESGASLLQPCNNYGVTCPGYEGLNYISLYWGDKQANPIRPLTTKELQVINLNILEIKR